MPKLATSARRSSGNCESIVFAPARFLPENPGPALTRTTRGKHQTAGTNTENEERNVQWVQRVASATRSPDLFEIVSRNSRLQLDASMADKKQRGRCHKAAKPLEAISRYSRTSQVNNPLIVPLTTHDVSLHNQACVLILLSRKNKNRKKY